MSADHDRVMVTVNVIYTFIDEQWPLKEFIERVESLNLAWGISDGN